MDWGLILAVTAVAFLVAHLTLDLRGLWQLLRTPHTQDSPGPCPRCTYARQGHGRQDIVWTTLTILVLLIHITLDFVA